MSKITKEMTIEDILNKFPHKSQKLAQEMTNFGLHCTSCSSAGDETLEEGMFGHGMNEKAVEALVEKLNQALEGGEEGDPSTIVLTPKAAKKFKQILADEEKTGWALRFGEESSGCRGSKYVLDYSEKLKENDILFTSEGIDIHVDKRALDRLLGSVIDYVDGLQGAGFKISNPNVKASCGCGNSHGY